jgi:hypothetical protein
MCSVSWKFQNDGYQLGFNRDEKWNRPLSADPSLENQHPIPGACARDGGGGGTWLFTNEHGITLAVMNAYPGGVIPIPGKSSRGLIPFHAANHASVPALEHALFAHAWDDHAPCDVVLFAPGEMRHYGWDGIMFRAHPAPPQPFLTASSVDCEVVRKARTARYRLISDQPIQHILDDDASEDPACAIHVRREDGGTVSRTFVTVTATEIHFSVARRGESVSEIIFPRKP